MGQQVNQPHNHDIAAGEPPFPFRKMGNPTHRPCKDKGDQQAQLLGPGPKWPTLRVLSWPKRPEAWSLGPGESRWHFLEGGQIKEMTYGRYEQNNWTVFSGIAATFSAMLTMVIRCLLRAAPSFVRSHHKRFVDMILKSALLPGMAVLNILQRRLHTRKSVLLAFHTKGNLQRLPGSPSFWKG